MTNVEEGSMVAQSVQVQAIKLGLLRAIRRMRM